MKILPNFFAGGDGWGYKTWTNAGSSLRSTEFLYLTVFGDGVIHNLNKKIHSEECIFN